MNMSGVHGEDNILDQLIVIPEHTTVIVNQNVSSFSTL